VKYVGHVVSEAGVEVDPAKTEKVVNWPKPINPEDVRRYDDVVDENATYLQMEVR
jgi:hypothetical protein